VYGPILEKKPSIPPIGNRSLKKKISLASRRNALKRVARESFRHAQAGLRGGDYLVGFSEAAASSAIGALRKELESAFKRFEAEPEK